MPIGAVQSRDDSHASFEDFDIVVIPGRKWEIVRSIAENTVYLLAQKNRVVVVEPFQSLPTLIREARAQKRSWTTSAGLKQLRENLWVYTPPPLGLPGQTRWKITHDVNSRILARLIQRVMRRLGFQHPLVWSFIYDSGCLPRYLPNRLSIYECIDNYEALARDDNHRRLVRAYERETCESSDIVFACSELLGSTRRVYNPNTFEVFCAADTEFFGRTMAPATQVPADIAMFPQPVLGYMGGCDPYKINLQLVRHIAQVRPDWSIVFVGHVWYGFRQDLLGKLPNVHFLGTKDYEQFPNYLRGMRVGLAPFNINDVTRFGDALKIYEYLAAGLPVVSTTNPAACRMREVVRIADDPDEFVRAIEAALQEPPVALQRRLQAVQAHTWQKRLEKKSEYIHDFLSRTPRSE